MKQHPPRSFKTWRAQEHETWKRLASRQLPNARGKVSEIFFEGIEKLKIPQDKIPDFHQLKRRLANQTGWKLISTDLEFADGQSWFETLARNEFFVTEYIRPLDSLEYTPKPDMFHDTFGHIPFLINTQLSDIIHVFTKKILAATLSKDSNSVTFGDTRLSLG